MLDRQDPNAAHLQPEHSSPASQGKGHEGPRQSSAARRERAQRQLTIGSGSTSAPISDVGDVPASLVTPLKLHDAIIRVLLDAGESLSANEIAARIRQRNLFVGPRSGHPLEGGQVSARVGNATYRHRFVRRDGRIWLADPEGERRNAPVA